MLNTRSQLSRLLYLHEQIILSNKVNSGTISRKYECSAKTIHRDIDFMRNDLGLPLEWDKKLKSFYYSKRVYGNYWKLETLKQFLDRIEKSY